TPSTTGATGGMTVVPQAGTDAGGASAGTPSGGAAGTATGGSGGALGDDMIVAPEGKIPNSTMPAGMVDLPKDSWPMGIVSPTLEQGHHQNQPVVINGYVEGAGNAELAFFD